MAVIGKGVLGGYYSTLCHCRPSALQAPSPNADAFLHYRTSKVRVLRAAHLERLVGELVSGDREQDPSFVPAFLATHRAFVPTGRVLGLLLPPPPPPLPPWSVPAGNLLFPPQTLTHALSNLEPETHPNSRTFLLSLPHPASSSDRGGRPSQGSDQEGRRTRSELQQEPEVGFPSGSSGGVGGS